MSAGFWGALGGAAASIGGSALGYALSAKEAKRQRRFQERMFRNRYQYSRQDLEAAGYNPILAVRQGPGSPPAGAQAQVPDFDPSRGISAGVQAASAKSAIANTQAQTAHTMAVTANEGKRGEILDLEKTVLERTAGRAQAESEFWNLALPVIRKFGSFLERQINPPPASNSFWDQPEVRALLDYFWGRKKPTSAKGAPADAKNEIQLREDVWREMERLQREEGKGIRPR